MTKVKYFLFTLLLLLIGGACQLADAQNLSLPIPARTWTSPGHTRYYVDSVGGSDTNDGKSPDHAWQTLSKVNSGIFSPGDWILLKCGGHWNGIFAPGGSGANRHPVKVTSYGNGSKPALDAQAQTLATVSIHNGEYWDIENLDITNTSSTPIPFLRGVEISLLNFGTAHDITLRHLDIHDISSSEDKGNGGSGIFCDNRGDTVRSRWDGLYIEDNHLVHTDRNGIAMDSGYWDRTKWYPSQHVIVSGNLLEHIGGDCICVIGCDGALIEHNIVRGGRERATDWAAGIWVWSCDNSIIQFNESSGLMGQMDAQGFDADWNTQNTIIQYNYSHDNQGGFVMACNNGSVPASTNVGNNGTIVRYNVSQNDNYRIFTLSGPVKNTQFYNNDIYVGKTESPILTFAWNWGGNWPDNAIFSNNIFYVDGAVNFQQGNMTNAVYNNNVFWGNFSGPPTDTHPIKANPLLRAPNTGALGTTTVDGYKPDRQSPCYQNGFVVINNGGRDYWGKRVPSNKPPTVGASQN